MKVSVDMWCREKLIEFERADLAGDEGWFAANWPLYRIEMTNHVIMTYRIFDWKAFVLWLRSSNDENAQELHNVLTEEARDFI